MPSNPAPAGISLADLAARIGATLDGDGDVRVHRVGTLENAGPGSLAFMTSVRYRSQLTATRAAAIILAPANALVTALPKLLHANPYAAYAAAAAILYPPAPLAPGVHATAIVDGSARIDPTAHVGPYAVIGAGADVGARACIGAGCAVGDAVELGADAVLHANVTLYARVVVGPRTIIHAGAVIGSDGFGMAEDRGRWLKIPQVGRVVIGADCEIGANTTIDRGAIDDTVIEDDVKLDNQIQIGHNCLIGAHTAIAGCVGIAGSTRIGRNCKVGGAAMISGHLTIADDVIISGCTGVFHSIDKPGVYTGAFPALPHREWQHAMSGTRRLRQLEARLHALEQAAGPVDSGKVEEER
ncbi:MAG: UDP-3-O-(3-hydroxymyristoyl)glucosamine N-acyltransferase [Betaproteobacteria bacterium]